jgi:hypothetical protein
VAARELEGERSPAMGAIDPDGPWPMDELDPDDIDAGAYMLQLLREAAGSEEALRALDDAPLPDEDFYWTGIPDDVHTKVAEVLALCDRCCEEMLDTEYRTACRRLLARAATGNPDVFRRKGRTETAAAAICWIVAKDNDVFGRWGPGLLVKDLMAHFGLQQGGVSQRADTMMKAAGYDPSTRTWELRLGSPELLVSSRRRRMIELRDTYTMED